MKSFFFALVNKMLYETLELEAPLTIQVYPDYLWREDYAVRNNYYDRNPEIRNSKSIYCRNLNDFISSKAINELFKWIFQQIDHPLVKERFDIEYHDVKLTRYTVGGHFGRHFDPKPKPTSLFKVLIFPGNPEYCGGDLIFYENGHEEILQPSTFTKTTAVLLRYGIEHQVSKITSGVRYVVSISIELNSDYSLYLNVPPMDWKFKVEAYSIEISPEEEAQLRETERLIQKEIRSIDIEIEEMTKTLRQKKDEMYEKLQEIEKSLKHDDIRVREVLGKLDEIFLEHAVAVIPLSHYYDKNSKLMGFDMKIYSALIGKYQMRICRYQKITTHEYGSNSDHRQLQLSDDDDVEKLGPDISEDQIIGLEEPFDSSSRSVYNDNTYDPQTVYYLCALLVIKS